MKDDGDTKDDVKIPEGDVGKKIKEAFEGDKTTSGFLLVPTIPGAHT